MWWGVDPLAGDAPGWTPYRYAFNNPVRYIDPNGMFETKFGAWLYKATHGFKGKVHYSESRKEYYVGRQIQSSNEARYDIRWGANTESAKGGLINAADQIPNLANTFSNNVVDHVVVPHGENIGKGMQVVGDGVAIGGYMAAPLTEGTSLLVSAVGEGISLFGKVVENASKIAKDGLTIENVIDASVDAAFEMAPVVIEGPIRKSGLDDAAKDILKAQNRKVLRAVEHAVDSRINESREN